MSDEHEVGTAADEQTPRDRITQRARTAVYLAILAIVMRVFLIPSHAPLTSILMSGTIAALLLSCIILGAAANAAVAMALLLRHRSKGKRRG